MSILVTIFLFYTMTEHSVMVSARGCPGSTCISPVWLDRFNLSLSLSLSLFSASAPVSVAVFLTVHGAKIVVYMLFLVMLRTDYLFWDWPDDVPAAPEPAHVWLVRLNTLSLPAPDRVVTRKDGLPTTLYPRMQLYSVLLVCILFFVLLRLVKIT